MACGRTKKTSSRSKNEGEARDKSMVPETDLESIHEEAQDVASSDDEDPRDLFPQLQKLIVNSKVVDLRRIMSESSHKLLSIYMKDKTRN